MDAKMELRKRKRDKFLAQLPLHLMLIIPVAIVIVYNYLPMVGIWMAFTRYVPTLDGFWRSLWRSEFVGFGIFRLAFGLPTTRQVFFNTIFISVMKIISMLIFPLIFALLLNEVKQMWFKKSVQTVTFIPFFLSWVILAGIFLDVFNPRDGIVNQMLGWVGIDPIFFFGEPRLFPFMMVITEIWKNIGFNTIVILAAIAGIDPSMYEAAVIDGAGHMKQARFITIPSVMPMMMLLAILSLGNVLNAGFDQIFNFYSPAVYSTGDIIDTLVFRTGLQQGNFSLGTAIGLLRSVVSLILISTSYFIAHKFSNYRIF